MDRQKDRDSDGTISHEVRDGLLRVTLTGQVVLSTATAYAVRHLETWSAHSAILWDLRKLDPSRMNSQDVMNVDQAFGEIMKERPGGRSAILITRELDLVTRIAIALGDKQGAAVAIRSFLKEQDAIDWLLSD